MAERNEYTDAEVGKVMLAEGDELTVLRDIIIRAHQQAVCHYVQSDAQCRRTIGLMLEAAIRSRPVMAGVLGRPGGDSSRDILSGSRPGDLS